MLNFQNILDHRSGRVRNFGAKRNRVRPILEALEERRVPTTLGPTGIASAVASRAVVAASTPTSSATPPKTPVLTLAVARSATEIDLAWTAVPNAMVYRVQDWTNGETSWTIVTGTSGTSAAIVGLTPNTDYSFEVDALSASGGVSGWSSAMSATTFPAAPVVNVTGESMNQVDLAWNSVAGATYYTVQTSNGQTTTVPGTSDSYNAGGLNPDTVYTFTVTADSAYGGSSSLPVTAVTYPAIPSFTVSAVSSSELDLAWTGTPGLSYQLSVASYFDWTLIGTENLSVPNNSSSMNYVYKLTGLAPLANYVLTLGAQNSSGTTWSSPVAASTWLMGPMPITATAESATTANLSWGAVPGASGYQIEYSSNGGTSWTMAPGASASTTSVNLSNLSPNTTYTFGVNAYNAAVTSGWTHPFSVTTFPAAPVVTATGESTSEIDLRWNAVPGATSYTVEQGTAPPVTLYGNTNTYYPDKGLNAGQVYVFTVTATDAYGSTTSSPVDTDTYPVAPTVSAWASSSSSIYLEWNAVPGATGYEIIGYHYGSPLQEFTLSGNSSTTFLDTGLTMDSTYFYQVTAFDWSGGTSSGAVEATTLPGPPASVTISTSATTITSGNSLSATITARDMLGYNCNNVDVELTATTGQSWSVPITNGVGTVQGITFTNPGTVVLETSYGNVGSDIATALITVDAATTTSGIWSGYAVAPGSGVTAAGQTWVQPSISGSSWGSSVSIWTGIDGFGGSTVEQCGVAATNVWGTPEYVAWYEFYGDQVPSSQNPDPNPKGPDYYQQNIPNFPVKPGDTISAEVSLVPWTTRSFLFQMTDHPLGGGPVETFSLVQTMQYVTPQLATADWIVENPNGGAQPLANYSSVFISGAWATVNSLAQNINQLNAVAITMTPTRGVTSAPTNPPTSSPYVPGYNEPSYAGSSFFSVNYSGPYDVVPKLGESTDTGAPGALPRTNGLIASQPSLAAAGTGPGLSSGMGALDAVLATGDVWAGLVRGRHREM